MAIRFTKHAHERMEERDISEEQVADAIKYPDKIGRSVFSVPRFVIKKVYYNLTLHRKHLLLVIYEERGENVEVITIIDTSKIDQYY